MPREIGSRIPRELRDELEREQPRKLAVPLISIDPRGFPHVALISCFELILREEELFFFLNGYSRSAKYLRERRICTLIFVQPGFAYYLKGMARFLEMRESQCIFGLKIDTVLEDFPSTGEGEALLTTGIRFDSSEAESQMRISLRARIVEALGKGQG